MLFRSHPARRSRYLAIALCGLLASGCTVGPDFHPPAALVRSEWNQAAHPLFAGPPANIDSWWIHFQDPTLAGLVQQTLDQNFSLREAAERILEARARRAVTAGNLYPQLQTADVNFAKLRQSANIANFFSAPPIFEPDLTPANWQAGLAASWELDFWGKYRRSIEAADGNLNATVAAYDEVRVLLAAEVTRAYIELRMAEARLALARNNLDIQQRTLEIVERKHAVGLAAGLDVDQGKINVGVTLAVIPTLETTRLQASHRLCVLLGRPPVDLAGELGFTGTIPVPDRGMCFGIPADLLRRRPDVRRAEHELAAQSAKIGIAESDFYPRISLNGNIGYAAEDFGKLFNTRSQVGLISPSFSWNLLNYGRIRNNVEAERAAFRALFNNYQQSVLDAAREAEDAQVAYLLSHDRLEGLQLAVKGAGDAVAKTKELYEAGTIDFGRVYVLQAGLLEQQDALAQTEAQIALSLVELFKSLGGGWAIHHATTHASPANAMGMHVVAMAPANPFPTAPPVHHPLHSGVFPSMVDSSSKTNSQMVSWPIEATTPNEPTIPLTIQPPAIVPLHGPGRSHGPDRTHGPDRSYLPSIEPDSPIDSSPRTMLQPNLIDLLPPQFQREQPTVAPLNATSAESIPANPVVYGQRSKPTVVDLPVPVFAPRRHVDVQPTAPQAAAYLSAPQRMLHLKPPPPKAHVTNYVHDPKYHQSLPKSLVP